MHGTDPAIYWYWTPFSQTENHLKVYDVRFPRKKKMVTMPLYRMPRVISHLDWPVQPFKQTEIGGHHQDHVGAPKPLPQM